MDIPINYVAVLIATVLAYAVGALWYTVLFGKEWMRLMGIDPNAPSTGRMSPQLSMGIGFFTTLLMVYVLAHVAFMFGVHDLVGALQLGLWVWVGFQAPLMANSVLYENRPFKLYAINASQQLVATLVAACALALI